MWGVSQSIDSFYQFPCIPMNSHLFLCIRNRNWGYILWVRMLGIGLAYACIYTYHYMHWKHPAIPIGVPPCTRRNLPYRPHLLRKLQRHSKRPVSQFVVGTAILSLHRELSGKRSAASSIEVHTIMKLRAGRLRDYRVSLLSFIARCWSFKRNSQKAPSPNRINGVDNTTLSPRLIPYQLCALSAKLRVHMHYAYA